MTATRERIERIQAEIKSLQPFFRQHAGGVCGGCDTPSEELLLDEYNDPMCFRCLGDTHEKAQKRIAQLAIDLSATLTALCEEMEREKWLPIVDAPVDGTEVRLLLKSGRTLTASLLWGFVDSNNRDCACWVCSDEDECPECWTDGACWQVNADGKPSDQPTHFQPLPQPPAT